MNTRGLTELVILNIGVMLGVLDGEMFTLMVIMAVVTTMMTAPLLNLVYPKRILDRDIAEAERAGRWGSRTRTRSSSWSTTPPATPPWSAWPATWSGGRARRRSSSAGCVRRTTPKPEVASGLTADLALLAEAGDELRQLSRIVDERGLRSSIASRFSDTPWADVAEIAAGAQPTSCSSAPDGVPPTVMTSSTPWPDEPPGDGRRGLR